MLCFKYLLNVLIIAYNTYEQTFSNRDARFRGNDDVADPARRTQFERLVMQAPLQATGCDSTSRIPDRYQRDSVARLADNLIIATWRNQANAL